jgi:cell division protein FtsZ
MVESDVNDLDNFEPVARIVVIGVGGAGNNAVNRMIDDDIQNVEFYVANTDKQALATSKASHRLVLGESVTKGLGAGGDPSIGKEAAVQSTEDIRKIVKGADMVFIAAGMGKGTGTGAAPVVASIAKEEGALTIAIVTRPFTFEGKQRIANSVEGLSELKDAVDSIIIVSNDKLLMSSGNVPISQAFQESDRVLAQSVKTVADLILVPAQINLDFADVRSTLKGAGIALIGFGKGQGRTKLTTRPKTPSTRRFSKPPSPAPGEPFAPSPAARASPFTKPSNASSASTSKPAATSTSSSASPSTSSSRIRCWSPSSLAISRTNTISPRSRSSRCRRIPTPSDMASTPCAKPP